MARIYSPELKAQVIAEWQLGTPKNEIARKLKIPRGTVQTWTRGEEQSAVISPLKKEDLGEMVFDYLAAALRALTVQADLAGDREWLKTWLKDDPAAGLHQLHGTIADKAIAVMAGIRREPLSLDGSDDA